LFAVSRETEASAELSLLFKQRAVTNFWLQKALVHQSKFTGVCKLFAMSTGQTDVKMAKMVILMCVKTN
jgi:hypothetical protein